MAWSNHQRQEGGGVALTFEADLFILKSAESH
jgi:hypothetical protein